MTFKMKNSDLALFKKTMSRLDQVPMPVTDCLEFNLLMESLDALLGVVDRRKLEIVCKYAESMDDGNIVTVNNEAQFKDPDTKARCLLETGKFMEEYSELGIKERFRISGKTPMTPAEARFIKDIIEVV